MSAHTPGPWRYKRHSFDSNFMLVFCSSSAGEGGNLSGYCGEANARLIAAAPDLLRELEKSTGILIALRVHIAGAVTPKVLADIDERIAAGEFAIAKATGESA